MSSRSIFYITAGSLEEAENVAHVLVDHQLAACVNVIPKIISYFNWEGKVQSEEEVLVLGKTKTELVDEVVQMVNETHSYELPCVITWKMDSGNQAFLDWISLETKQPG